jgi:hypothetical protein
VALPSLQNDWLQDEVRRTEEEAGEYESYMETKTVRERLKVRCLR